MMDGTVIQIGSNVANFYNKLQELPIQYRIELFCDDIFQLETYIIAVKYTLSAQCINLLKKKYYFAETGDEADLDDEYLFELMLGIYSTRKKIIPGLKKMKYTHAQMQHIVDVLTNPSICYSEK